MNAGWLAVLEPGDVPGGAPALPPPVAVGGDGDCRPLLGWLAALSWLSYFPYSRQEDGLEVGRGHRLAQGRLEERLYLSCSGIDCSLLVPATGTGGAVVVFRGTVGFRQWVYNVDVIPRAWEGGGKAHAGFARALAFVWPHLKPRLEELSNEGQPVCFTGHSLGGALATLAAALWSGGRTPAFAATFGAPRVGNAEFAAAYTAASHPPLWRVVLGGDPVPGLPAPIGGVSRMNYTDIGTVVELAGKSAACPGNRLTLKQWRAAFESKNPPAFLADHAPGCYARALLAGRKDAIGKEGLKLGGG